MRHPDDIAAFAEANESEFADPNQFLYYMSCYQACVPKTFWDVSSASVNRNLSTFKKVLKYCAKRKTAQKNGLGLLFTGDNGTGKSTFVSFVLTQMLRRGCSVYYTTLSGLDKSIKQGFDDKQAARRLDRLLDSDFLAIDELGKEYHRSDSFLNARLEMLLKQRCDDGDPTLLASNMDYAALCTMYGGSIGSILDGKYVKLAMAEGDSRKLQSARISKELGI